MVIFYHKKTGQIYASFPECYNLNPKITIKAEGAKTIDITKHTLSPQESYDFEDPRNPKQIHDHKIEMDNKGKVIGFKRIRPSKEPKKDKEFIPLLANK